MNITPNVLRAFAQAFQLVADALDQPAAQPGLVPVLNLNKAFSDVFIPVPPIAAAPATEAPKAKRATKAKPAPVASDDDDDLPPAKKPAPVASDDDDEAPPAKKPAPVASDDDDEAPVKPSVKPVAGDDEPIEGYTAPKAKPAPVAVVNYAMLRAEAAALLVAYVDEHGMSLAAKVLRKHGADKVSKVADVSLQSLVDALKAGEPE